MTSNSGFLEKVRAIVLQNYTDEQFGVSELVAKLGKSRSQVHRKVKSASGKSLSQFIREIRLDESLKILKKEDITASEVAYQVGFNSPTYFNTCFNEYFGYPPGEVKLRVASGAELITEKRKPVKKNKWILVWVAIITLLVVTFLAVKFWAKDSSAITSEGIEKPKTIAVLPFKNWSGDPELEYVSDGMTDAVITRLSGISDIQRVVPYSTVVRYKNSEKTTNAIAAELNVEFILEGNFKLSGERVMSNLNLIEVQSNKYLWTLEYTGNWKTDEIFEMQAAVAENVAKNMRVDITDTEKMEIAHIPTNNEAAYLTYLQANSLFLLLNNEGFKAAIPLFKKAISLDSTYVEPYIQLANNYAASGAMWGVMKEKEAWTQAKFYFEEALRIDNLKNGYYHDEIMGIYCFSKFMHELDFDCLEEFIEKDLGRTAITSNNPFYYFIQYHQKVGRHDLAMELWYKAMTFDPKNHYNQMAKGISYFYLDQPEKTLEIFAVLDPHFSNDFYYLIETAKYYYYMGEMEKSKHQLDKILKNFEARPPIILWLQAVHAQMEGNNAEAVDHLNKLSDMYENGESGSPAWFTALYFCHLKDYDSTMEWLNKSFERLEIEMTWFKEEPMLQPLKDDPLYLRIYKEIGFDRFDKTIPIVN